MSDKSQAEMTAAVELGIARAKIEKLEGQLRAGVIEAQISGVAELVGELETLEDTLASERKAALGLHAAACETEEARVELVGKVETLEERIRLLVERAKVIDAELESKNADLDTYDEAHDLTRKELADSEDKRNIAEHASSLASDHIDGLREKLWRLEGRCSGLLEAMELHSK